MSLEGHIETKGLQKKFCLQVTYWSRHRTAPNVVRCKCTAEERRLLDQRNAFDTNCQMARFFNSQEYSQSSLITPPARSMACSTISPILPVMLIFMTGITTGRESLIDTIPVTGFAGNVSMFALQRERCNVMVETRVAPAVGAMTGSTVRPESPAMVIIRCVTGITVRGCAAINSVCMAGVTGQAIVSAGQWETCIVMIKGRATPTIRGMAGTAIRTKLPVVRII